ncbi:MAG: AAA family ATPase [Bdellovibrionaceae bacterium]|nr:AAA family ATPase [Pseudobdellovibrionaceae bacterium]|tara:strand:+ start:10330 stop:11502 length:1173 start_codon:yes stop_codon:yes gene_type:complete
MYQRELSSILLDSLQSYDILTLLGPRQSGKTTLVQVLFPHFEYRSLENPDERERAQEDPKGFLRGLSKNVILDEFQRVPKLSSYIQGIVDHPNNDKKFILTGSNGLMLVDSITQTLAGRTQLFELLPLSFREIYQKNKEIDLDELLIQGGYPKIYDKKLNSRSWHQSYFQLYVEKDIRLITQLKNIDLFENFVRLAAGRAGQLINYSSLGNEVGVSAPTIQQWISALKTTYICFSLPAHFKNFNKRIVKSSKLYFYDTGLLCYLLGIYEKKQLENHPLRGNIFENFVVSEFVKNKMNQGLPSQYYFWRDQKGHEIDLLDDRSSVLFPIEIKKSETFNSSFIKNINYFNKLIKEASFPHEGRFGKVIYCGDQDFIFKDVVIENWRTSFLTD